MDDNLILYRFYGNDGQLLYIGKSISFFQRLKQHRRDSPFFHDITSITLERGFATEDELLQAETAAIKREDPLHNVKDAITDLDRFVANVDQDGDCWEWTGARGPRGRGAGLFRVGGKTQSAWRAAYALFVGDIPPNYKVLRSCKNTLCVNPEHLELDFTVVA